MDYVMVNHREQTLVEKLREIEAEMVRLQSMIDESQAHLEAYRQELLYLN